MQTSVLAYLLITPPLSDWLVAPEHMHATPGLHECPELFSCKDTVSTCIV